MDVKYNERIVGLKKLPLYILVRINRFKTKESEKIKRKIEYPKHLSLLDFCHENLKKELAEGIATRDK